MERSALHSAAVMTTARRARCALEYTTKASYSMTACESLARYGVTLSLTPLGLVLESRPPHFGRGKRRGYGVHAPPDRSGTMGLGRGFVVAWCAPRSASRAIDLVAWCAPRSPRSPRWRIPSGTRRGGAPSVTLTARREGMQERITQALACPVPDVNLPDYPGSRQMPMCTSLRQLSYDTSVSVFPRKWLSIIKPRLDDWGRLMNREYSDH
jgi:hypothetical protein